MTRKSPAALGLLASVLVTLAAGVAHADDAMAPARPEAVDDLWLQKKWVMTDLTALAAALAAWRRDHGEWPADCPAAAAAGLAPTPSKDPWGSPYACALEAPERVISAGPDRVAGTQDDLVRRLDGKDAGGEASAAPASSGASSPAPAAPVTDEARVTTDRLVWLSRALESFRKREGHYPVADQGEYLEQWLVPNDLPASQWFAQDGWTRAWRYRVTDTGSSYSLSSGGADGRWEPLAPPTPRATSSADGDLVVVEGRFVRWPSGYQPEAIASGAPRAAEPEAPKEPADPAAATTWRLERLVAALERSGGKAGAWPQSDDAERLFGELGVKMRAVDGWGRPIDYLSIGGGSHFALISRGPDGRASRSPEDYARGAAPAGDDVVIRR